jgi:Uma2 family endonuclease
MTTFLIEPSLQDKPRPMEVRFPPSVEMSDDDFFEFCQLNGELRIERTAEGEIIIMPPTGGETGHRNVKIIVQLELWSGRDGSGHAFGSSTGFMLPNGAERSPDAAWVLRSRLATLTKEQKQRFLPLCPDFVIELRSPSDTVAQLRNKLEEYMENGARLGWLLDPATRRVHIYRPGLKPEIVEGPADVSGETVLPGFTLNLKEIWDPGL